MEIKSIVRNITPAIAVMFVGVLGAYLVYDSYFSNKVAAVQISTFEPAAGEESAAPAEETAPAAEMVAPAVENGMIGEEVAPAIKTDEEGCLLNEVGEKTLDDYGNCIKPPPQAVEGAVPAAGEEGAPAAEGEAAPAVPATEGDSVE